MTYATSTAATSPADSPAIQTKLSCPLEGLSPTQRDQRRSQVLHDLNLYGAEAVPIFDEAVQNVSRLLAMPICILSVVDTDKQHFKSAVGLSSLGLMNQLAAARSIDRMESFCTHVVDSSKTFALENATAHPAFSRSLLVQQYGIQSYLGVPLFTANGCCIGTLAVMDLMPHAFTQQEVSLLELTARWCMSEFEKQQIESRLQQGTHPLQTAGQGSDPADDSLLAQINKVRFDLIVQLTQDLRSPLTSITGMANMLSREIYGPLSEKQQEYANIVLSSSQNLLSRVNEIVEISDLEESGYQLSIASVDVDMVAQQAIASLNSLAQAQDLKIQLTVEPGSRVWNLDKRIVKQLIYHLVFSLIKMSTAGSTIRLHISRKDTAANIALWVSNPWLGEDLPQAVIAWSQRSQQSQRNALASASQPQRQNALAGVSSFAVSAADGPLAHSDASYESQEVFEVLATAQKVDASRQELGLLLSQHLTEMHGGSAIAQGSPSGGYRYIITLPSVALPN